MSISDQFPLAIHALQEIQAILHRDENPLPATLQVSPIDAPTDQVAAIPDGSLLLGLAEDGLPIILDLYDSTPGPLLVVGDGGSGKTAFLKALARTTNIQDPGEIQFGVLTPFPEEWSAQENLPNCLGIWPAGHSSAGAFLTQLISWAEVLPQSRQSVLVLFDGLDLVITGRFQARQDLHWLLMHGPERHIWPVVTINPGRLNRLGTWLEFFQTRILGQVKRSQSACLLVGNQDIDLNGISPGKQFVLWRTAGWLKFRMPSK
jgi:hypothetical protein